MFNFLCSRLCGPRLSLREERAGAGRVGRCRSEQGAAAAHSGPGSRPGLALGPPARRRVWVELRSGEQTKPSLAAEPSSVYCILFFKEKASLWFLFVVAAISWTLIELPLATASICFQGLLLSEGVIFKDFRVKTQTARSHEAPPGRAAVPAGGPSGWSACQKEEGCARPVSLSELSIDP